MSSTQIDENEEFSEEASGPTNRISEWRVARGLAQHELAAIIGTSQQTVARLEKGHRKLTLEWLQKLSSALKVSLLDLLDSKSGGENIMINGIAGAGLWKHEAFLPLPERMFVSLPVDHRYEGIPKFGVELEDKFAGSPAFAVCIDMAHLQHILENEKEYLIQRINDSGEFEVSICQFVASESGQKWLMPQYARPEHRAPISYREHSPFLSILARVIGLYIQK